MSYVEDMKNELNNINQLIENNINILNSNDIVADDKLYLGLQIEHMKKYKEYIIKRLSLYDNEQVCSISNSYDTALNECFK